ncbi:MAG: NAD(P)H-quinone oxidoreductase [Clostridia bacterium]|nr:NAD(P)H-quinone oxidoreductase [Clostridia bacterium]
MEKMKAVLVENNELVLSEVTKPQPKKGEVLIKIYAAALNRADLLQRKGTYPSPAGWPQWPGLEVSGVVESIGADTDCKFQAGDKVCALLGGGGYAEYICVPYGMVMPMPSMLTFEQAATLPEAYATSYLNLYIEGKLKPGQTAFIPAGASGIASVAIPMAKALGSRVITSVLSDEIAEKIKHLGADVIINSVTQDVAEVLKKEEENGHPVNVALDCLSGEILGKAITYMAEGGYWIIISTLAGPETTMNLRPVLQKGIHLVGSMLRKRSVEEKTEILSQLVEVVWPKIESGEMVPSIYKVLPLEKADEAMSILESGTHVGKVVLSVCK